ncbi:MAG: hypothetical protein JOZ54_05125 [Acidobacteria bacterium]|nr:hypothetical protein [Acidobacteriota bacterium]
MLFHKDASVRRLVNPLTGSTTWVEMEGTVVRKVWNGWANLVELGAQALVAIRTAEDFALRVKVRILRPLRGSG